MGGSLTTGGFRALTVHQALDLKSTYEPGVIETMTAVTVVDDVAVSVDLVREATVLLEADPADGRIHWPDVTYEDCSGAPEAPAGEGKAPPRRMACSAGVARRIHVGASAA